jgi:hypothetical protein
MRSKKLEKVTPQELEDAVNESAIKAVRKSMQPAKWQSINDKKLAKLGLHAHFEHYRFQDKSAITECMIEDKDRAVKARGFSICSHKDNFCKEEGRIKSLGRAIAALENKKNMFQLFPNSDMCKKNEAMFAFNVEVSEYLGLYLDQKLAPKNNNVL